MCASSPYGVRSVPIEYPSVSQKPSKPYSTYPLYAQSTKMGVTMKVLVNGYLNHKKALLDANMLSPRAMQNYHEAAALLVERFGKW